MGKKSKKEGYIYILQSKKNAYLSSLRLLWCQHRKAISDNPFLLCPSLLCELSHSHPLTWGHFPTRLLPGHAAFILASPGPSTVHGREKTYTNTRSVQPANEQTDGWMEQHCSPHQSHCQCSYSFFLPHEALNSVSEVYF